MKVVEVDSSLSARKQLATERKRQTNADELHAYQCSLSDAYGRINPSDQIGIR